MLNLNDLHFFVHVMDHGGFAAAARKLHIPKSTLSKRVAELEKSVGARLIHRTSRSFVPTEMGRNFYRHAVAALIEAEAAENLVKGRLAEPSGAVRITCSVPTAQISLADLLPTIARTYPKIQLEVHATDRFVDIVQEGFDIAVRDHFKPLPDSELVQRRIGSGSIFLIAAPSYLEEQGVPGRPEDLAGHEGLLSSQSEDNWILRDQAGRQTEVRPKRRFTADESTVLLRAATAGLGIARLPRKLCQRELETGKLVRVLPDWTAGEVLSTLLIPHRRGLLPSVRVVCDALAEAIAAQGTASRGTASQGTAPQGTASQDIASQDIARETTER
ncbi:LysR substrate-binding domain-containing protein [Gilvimarinus sp. F26214L]|uniref:LysR substrate-binding domain-containing protein n=1 Tax=Gilvimarinus sp. DZF01 TaxID=3461371 RepID=UPI0040466468